MEPRLQAVLDRWECRNPRPLSGDAGARRYFRVDHPQLGTALVVMYPPPDPEKPDDPYYDFRALQAFLDPVVRVARSLASLFNPVLYPGVGEVLRITQQELAYLVGLSRQRVNEALAALEQQGAIRTSGLFSRSISRAAMNCPRRSLSWFITKRLKPMEWSSSQ